MPEMQITILILNVEVFCFAKYLISCKLFKLLNASNAILNKRGDVEILFIEFQNEISLDKYKKIY